MIAQITPNIIIVMKTIKEICGITFKLKNSTDDYLKMKEDRFESLKNENESKSFHLYFIY